MFLVSVVWGFSILLAWDECLYISTGEGSALIPLPALSHAVSWALGFFAQESMCHFFLCDVLCPSTTAEKSLLELSHPQDEAEEELPDGLDESCSQEEYEDSECWFPREGCAPCLNVGRAGAVWELGVSTAALLSYIHAVISGCTEPKSDVTARRNCMGSFWEQARAHHCPSPELTHLLSVQGCQLCPLP